MNIVNCSHHKLRQNKECSTWVNPSYFNKGAATVVPSSCMNQENVNITYAHMFFRKEVDIAILNLGNIIIRIITRNVLLF